MGLVRLFLAFAVAGDHLFVVTLIPAGFGTRGVDQFVWVNAGFAVFFFYVISGFLISFALDGKYRDDVSGFYRGRFIRIFSLYWPLLLAASLLFRYGPHSVLDHVVSIFVVGGDWVSAFSRYPVAHNPYFGVLGPAWTLAAELTFYLMAPWLLRSLPVALLVFAASFALRLFLQWTYGFHDAWLYRFFPAVICVFLLGHFAQVAYRRWSSATIAIGLAALVAAVLSVRITLDTGSWVSPWFYVGLVAFAAALPWVFEATAKSRWMNYVGDLSFPVYLCHGFVLTAFNKWAAGLLQKPGGAVAFGLLFFVTLLATSAIVHAIVERPVAHCMKAAFARLPRRAQQSSPPASGPPSALASS